MRRRDSRMTGGVGSNRRHRRCRRVQNIERDGKQCDQISVDMLLQPLAEFGIVAMHNLARPQINASAEIRDEFHM